MKSSRKDRNWAMIAVDVFETCTKSLGLNGLTPTQEIFAMNSLLQKNKYLVARRKMAEAFDGRLLEDYSREYGETEFGDVTDAATNFLKGKYQNASIPSAEEITTEKIKFLAEMDAMTER